MILTNIKLERGQDSSEAAVHSLSDFWTLPDIEKKKCNSSEIYWNSIAYTPVKKNLTCGRHESEEHFPEDGKEVHHIVRTRRHPFFIPFFVIIVPCRKINALSSIKTSS